MYLKKKEKKKEETFTLRKMEIMEDLHLSVQSVHFLLFSLVLSVMIKISMLPRSLRPDLVFSCIFTILLPQHQ